MALCGTEAAGITLNQEKAFFSPAVARSMISQRTLCYARWQEAEGCVMDALLSSRKSYAATVCSGGEEKNGTKNKSGAGRGKKKNAAAAAAAAKQQTVKC